MTEQPSFISQQQAFAAHLRDPERVPAPTGIEDRRMAIYRDLVFNNLASLLSANFPVIRRLLPDERWNRLVRGFLTDHRAHTPLFLELPQELLRYLEAHPEAQDPPFLLELAHYEWVELALRISECESDLTQPDLSEIDPEADLLATRPMRSPLAWPLSYRFPVHRIGPELQPEAPPAEPTHLVVYRGRDDQVGFLETNAVTQRLLYLLDEDPGATGRALLERLAGEMGHPEPERLIGFGAAFLDDLREKGVILGGRAPSKSPPESQIEPGRDRDPHH